MQEKKEPPRLTPAQVARLINVPEATLGSWRCRNQGPPWYKVGGLIRYRESEVQAWLEDQRHDPSAEVNDGPAQTSA